MVSNNEESVPENNFLEKYRISYFYTRSVRKVMTLCRFIFLAIGLVFVAVGVVSFLGFTVPENIDSDIARNERLETIDAKVTGYSETLLNMDGVLMYKIEFEWEDGRGESNPAFTQDEAQNLYEQESIKVRLNGTRAVMVDYQRSGLSLMGLIFIGVFGGMGAIFLITSGTLFCLSIRTKTEEKKAKAFN